MDCCFLSSRAMPWLSCGDRRRLITLESSAHEGTASAPSQMFEMPRRNKSPVGPYSQQSATQREIDHETKQTSLVLATIIAALAGASAFDGASAGYLDNRFGYRSFDGGFYSYRAPQPNQSLRGAAPRPSNRDMRGSSDKGGDRGMRGGGRMNGGMGRR